ncbi:MAG: YdiU family protein [Pseudomonadota bacterium]
MNISPPHFDNSYVKLPERFYRHQAPVPVKAPGLIRVNYSLAESLGVDPAWLESREGIETVAGNTIPAGAEPIATVYAGHQFGNWNPQLGDGRAVLLGELVNKAGERFDLQLKGSGPTPYSRGGDGRAPLGPVLREYVVSEAMAALGVPTTRSLAAVTTGEYVYREEPLPGAVLARVARSHIRIGTLQFFAAQGDTEGLKILADHVISRHYPDLTAVENPYLALLDRVITRQTSLVATWQLLGFIHGVMNTDNMLLSGETIDYGPCAFMDAFDPATVFSSIDHGGRYAYQNQPRITHWNLMCLAQALLPLINPDTDEAVAPARALLDSFPGRFIQAHDARLLEKIGLQDNDAARDLGHDLLKLMGTENSDFTLTFARLTDIARGTGTLAQHITLPDSFAPWLSRWEAMNPDADRMHRVNPVFIPRNHLLHEAITVAEQSGDLTLFHKLVDVLAQPFADPGENERYALPPGPEDVVVTATFCGT